MKYIRIYESFNNIIDLNEYWQVYYNNFSLLYPSVSLRSKERDIKTICDYFINDIKYILIGKEVEFKDFASNLVRCEIKDVHINYLRLPTSNVVNLNFRIKVDGRWRRIKNNILLVIGDTYNELEENLKLYISAKKYNL